MTDTALGPERLATDKVLLVGLMGAGKSAVGAALSARLRWPYLDNDSLLVRTSGLTAPEILEKEGEQALREAESRVLTLMLAFPGPMIGGLPGGVVVDETDRTRLANCGSHVVWLRTSVQVLARRVGSGAGRAWLDADPLATLRVLAAERNGYYEQVAHQVVDTDALPAGAIAKLVVEALDASQ
ncbi:MAG: shikimate kinase [Frankiales bacterium]|nr:shikimate kinase [Frankiales bacterium]